MQKIDHSIHRTGTVKIPFNEIQRIAIFRRNGLGDVLCAMPLVLRCKELMPQAKITLFLEKNALCLTPHLQGPDEFAQIPSSWNKYVALCKLLWQRRGKPFDLALSAKTTPMKLMNLSLYGLKAPYRAAYVLNHWHDRLINCSSPYKKKPITHQALQAIHLIDPTMTELPKRLYPLLHSVDRHRLFPQKTLLISASNNRGGSILSSQRIAYLLNAVATLQPFAVAISALAKDLSKAQEIASLLTMQNKIFITNQFPHFLSLLNSADAIFACDGGIVHLSSALQKPSLFLFGGTNVSQWGPMNPLASTLFYPGHVMQIPEKDILKELFFLLSTIKSEP